MPANIREVPLDSKEFIYLRKKLKKTQKELAQLLGTSIKAVHSYEQGWRGVPPHVERQLLFLVSRVRAKNKTVKPCWVIKKCPTNVKKKCPAWEFRAGTLCWFISGTICKNIVHKDWREKMETCKSCEVFSYMLEI